MLYIGLQIFYAHAFFVSQDIIRAARQGPKCCKIATVPAHGLHYKNTAKGRKSKYVRLTKEDF